MANELRTLVATDSSGVVGLVLNPLNKAQAWDNNTNSWATYDRTDTDQQVSLGSSISAGGTDEWQYGALPTGLNLANEYLFDVYSSGGELLTVVNYAPLARKSNLVNINVTGGGTIDGGLNITNTGGTALTIDAGGAFAASHGIKINTNESESSAIRITSDGDGVNINVDGAAAYLDGGVADLTLVNVDAPTLAQVILNAATGTYNSAGTIGKILNTTYDITNLLNSADIEPTGVPAADETPLDKLGYLFMALRNKVTITDSTKTYFDNDGNSEWSKSISDDGTTYIENKVTTSIPTYTSVWSQPVTVLFDISDLLLSYGVVAASVSDIYTTVQPASSPFTPAWSFQMSSNPSNVIWDDVAETVSLFIDTIDFSGKSFSDRDLTCTVGLAISGDGLTTYEPLPIHAAYGTLLTFVDQGVSDQ